MKKIYSVLFSLERAHNQTLHLTIFGVSVIIMFGIERMLREFLH